MRCLSPLLLWALAAATCSAAAAAGVLWGQPSDQLGGCTAGAPLAPTNLTAEVLSEGAVTLRWSRRPCAAYTVTVFPSGKSTAAGKTFKIDSPSAIILGLSPTTNYTAEVRATRPRGMFASQPAVLFFRATAAAAGPAATGPAAPATAATKGATGAAGTTVGPDGWACTPREGYPACSAGQAGLCVPASCADMARLGRCASTNLRVADWAARAVTQHCASECGGCAAATPVLGGRPADRIAPPHDFCCAYGEGQYFRTADRYAVSDAAADF